jgi:phosphate transport system substrate-binding protein
LPENVASGAYRLALPFHLVALQEPTGAARRFVDFCLSPEGQEIVARTYLPVR